MNGFWDDVFGWWAVPATTRTSVVDTASAQAPLSPWDSIFAMSQSSQNQQASDQLDKIIQDANSAAMNGAFQLAMNLLGSQQAQDSAQQSGRQADLRAAVAQVQQMQQRVQQAQAQQSCSDQGGTWANNSCDMSAVLAARQRAAAEKNRQQLEECYRSGGTWTGNSDTGFCKDSQGIQGASPTLLVLSHIFAPWTLFGNKKTGMLGMAGSVPGGAQGGAS